MNLIRYALISILIPAAVMTACNKSDNTPATKCRLTDVYTVAQFNNTDRCEILYDMNREIAGCNEPRAVNVTMNRYTGLIVCNVGGYETDSVFLNPAGMISEIRATPSAYYTRQQMSYANDSTLNFIARDIIGGGRDTIWFTWQDGDMIADSSTGGYYVGHYNHFKGLASNDAEPYVLNQLKRYGACYYRNRHMVASHWSTGPSANSQVDKYKPTMNSGKLDFMRVEFVQSFGADTIPSGQENMFYRYVCD